jgi:hypothetical protein
MNTKHKNSLKTSIERENKNRKMSNSIKIKYICFHFASTITIKSSSSDTAENKVLEICYNASFKTKDKIINKHSETTYMVRSVKSTPATICNLDKSCKLQSFVQNLHSVNLQNSTIMVTFDVVSQFSKAPLQENLQLLG